jgi:hypothetical protein
MLRLPPLAFCGLPRKAFLVVANLVGPLVSSTPSPAAGSTGERAHVASRWIDLLAVCVLFALAVWLFRKHVSGQATYIGNPDRLSSNLKILKLHAEGIARGHLDAWSDSEMMGYDSFALPYTFPNVTTYLTNWLGVKRLYVTSGFISLTLLALAGSAAYVFLQALNGSQLASLAGAILYQFSALSILKVSQNDMSFAVFIMIPLMALVVLRTGRGTSVWRFAQLALLVFLLLHFMFLQKAAYALLLLGCYALYRSARGRDWRPLGVFAGAMLTGTVAAFPRIWGIATAMAQHSRLIPGLDLHNFEDVYRYQHILPYQILRWFDDSFFGRYPAEANVVLDNNVNLTEGFLLYTSSFVPFLLLLTLVRFRHRWLRLPLAGRNDTSFFFWFFAFGIAVVTCKPVHHLVYLLFLSVDFTHARILVAALLALVVLVTAVLADLRPRGFRCLSGRRLALVAVGAVALQAAMVLAVEGVAHHWKGRWEPLFGWDVPHPPGYQLPVSPDALRQIRTLPVEFKPFLSEQALARIGASALAVGLVFAALRLCKRKPVLASVCWGALVLALPVQAVLAADFRINGPHTGLPAAPFEGGNNYRASRSEFVPPSKVAVADLAERLERDCYRCVLVPDPTTPWGFAGGHVPEFWRLRALDGYYGLGVPTRLAALPWPQGIGLRTISFPDEHLPWPLLSLLNVKYALVVDRGLFTNSGGRPPRVLENPATVVPRCFFARSVEPVSSVRKAAARLFEGRQVVDVRARSFVEGLPETRSFDSAGDIHLCGGGDRLEISFDRSERERFLVVNDLFFPGWQATVDGRSVRIYATNAVMRGIPIPARASSVVLTYVPFVRTPWALLFYGAGLILLLGGALLFHRAERASAKRAGVAPVQAGSNPDRVTHG